MNSSHHHARRLVHLAEGAFHIKEAKTTVGVLRYGIHETAAVIDSTKAGKTCQEVVGVGGSAPVVSSLEEALAYKPNCLLIGVAPRGGALPESWRSTIRQAIEAGLDIYSGLHTFLSEDPEFVEAAHRKNVRLWDVRKAPKGLPVALGLTRYTKSYVNLTIGTDCSVGKMTTSLEIQRVLRARGRSVEFVATGQTGIMISGWGHPIDAIAGDFMSGAVEMDCMSVDGRCDIILVEGQATLIHPGYSGVTLALLQGAMPDSLILCHHASRLEVARGYKIPFPPMLEMARRHTDTVNWIRESPYPTKCLGVSVATWDMSEDKARDAIQRIKDETGLPATDPVRFGAEPLAEAILEHQREIGKPAQPISTSLPGFADISASAAASPSSACPSSACAPIPPQSH